MTGIVPGVADSMIERRRSLDAARIKRWQEYSYFSGPILMMASAVKPSFSLYVEEKTVVAALFWNLMSFWKTVERFMMF